MTPFGKGLAIFFSLGLCLIVAWPVQENFKETPKDSFPLSYYPMFTTLRPPHYAVSHPAAADMNGKVYHLPFTILGQGGFNQTRRQISRSVREGRAQLLADLLAENVSQAGLKGEAPFKSVAIITSVYKLDDYYRGVKKPFKRIVRAISKVDYSN